MPDHPSILETINAALNSPSDKVTVFPFMCGSGKSTAIKQKIREVILSLESGSRDGMIIITDTIRGLKSYVEPDDDKEQYDFCKAHDDKWVVITTQNASTLEKYSKKHPIMLMTTQRYFQMDIEKISALLTTEQYRRPLIIIDEAPYLIDGDIIDFSSFAAIEAFYLSMIVMEDEEGYGDYINTVSQLQDELSSTKTKLLTARSFFQSMRNGSMLFRWIDTASDRESERQNAAREIIPYDDDPKNHDMIYDINHDTHHSQDVIQFHRQLMQMKAKGNNEIKRLFQVYEHLYSFGGMQYFQYNQTKHDYFANGYYITWNNKERLTNLPAKVIILDGTANIHPDYRQDYLDLKEKECEVYLRKLDHLHIHIVDIPTGKSKMETDRQLYNIGKRSKIWQTVEEYISERHTVTPVIFTYKEYEQLFKNTMNEISTDTAHFGRIKGRNDFKDKHLFAQIGVFQAPEYYYFSRYMEIHPDIRESFAVESNNPFLDKAEALSQLQESVDYQEYKARLMLVDIEQNVFRSSAREAKSTEQVNYYIFASKQYYGKLFEMLDNRFRSYYGAHVDYQTPPESLKQIINPPPKRTTQVDTFLQWHAELPSGKFKLKLFKDKYQYNMDKLKCSPKIKEILKKEKIPGKNEYLKP